MAWTEPPEDKYEAILVAIAESHAAMRNRTRTEALDLYAEMRANGAMIPVAEWELDARSKRQQWS